jgi:hypothetical protein
MFFVLPLVIQVQGNQIKIRIGKPTRIVGPKGPRLSSRSPVPEVGFSNSKLRRLLMAPGVN